jgi:hypothetical protein
MHDPAPAVHLQSRDMQIALDNALRQVELTMIGEGGFGARGSSIRFTHLVFTRVMA